MTNTKQEGFTGQLLFRLNPDQLNEAKAHPTHRLLHASAIGYYPHADNHYVDRPDGISSHILIHCISGNGWFRINNQRYTVCEGEFCIIPADTPHQYGSDADWGIYWVHIEGEMAATLLGELIEGGYAARAEPRRDLAIELFRDLLRQLSSLFTGTSLSYLHFSLWRLLGIYTLAESFPEAESYRHTGIRSVIAYMKENVAGQLTLQEMADYARLSVSRFSQLFREQTGHSPIDFYIRLKIQRAGQLLTSTSLKIQDIASICGWENPYYFSRSFRSITGQSPKEYRKLYHI